MADQPRTTGWHNVPGVVTGADVYEGDVPTQGELEKQVIEHANVLLTDPFVQRLNEHVIERNALLTEIYKIARDPTLERGDRLQRIIARIPQELRRE